MRSLSLIAGLVLNRVRGGMWSAPGFPNVILRGVYAIGLAGALWAVSGAPWPFVVASLVGCYIAATLGHASHMDIGTAPDGQPADGQTYEPTTRWLEPFDLSAGWRDGVAMSFIGMIRGLLASGAFLLVDPWLIAYAAAGGLLQGPAYWLGWRPWLPVVERPVELRNGVEWGEALSGAALFGSIAAYAL